MRAGFRWRGPHPNAIPGLGIHSRITQAARLALSPSPFRSPHSLWGAGSNYQFTATVTGTTNTAVNWEVSGTGASPAAIRTIDNTGFYIAPQTILGGTISVTAVAQADGTTLTQCVGLLNAQKYLDPAYPTPICSQALQTQSTAHAAQFLSDSILSPEATLSYPNTSVHFVWGGLDTSSAPVMGQEWQKLITSTNAFACVADAPHDLADASDGAAQIVSDIAADCR